MGSYKTILTPKGFSFPTLKNSFRIIETVRFALSCYIIVTKAK